MAISENYAVNIQKGKQKSPGRAASRSRSQPLTPGNLDACINGLILKNVCVHDFINFGRLYEVVSKFRSTEMIVLTKIYNVF